MKQFKALSTYKRTHKNKIVCQWLWHGVWTKIIITSEKEEDKERERGREKSDLREKFGKKRVFGSVETIISMLVTAILIWWAKIFCDRHEARGTKRIPKPNKAIPMTTNSLSFKVQTTRLWRSLSSRFANERTASAIWINSNSVKIEIIS